MKVYSWNMLFKNAELDRALTFIEQSDFDIFCLQEVPQEFLDRLTVKFPYCASAIESQRTYKSKVGTHYLVTLSRYPIQQSSPIPLSERSARAPARAEQFSRVMFATRLWARGHGDRNNLYTQVAMPSGNVSVYNLHLPLKHPAWRAEEFEHSLRERDRNEPTIVCGDFNIVESPHITILNWLLGGSFADAILYTRERKQIEMRFAAHGLHNPLRSKSTHPLSKSQLDHILVSSAFSVANAGVSRDRFGSDHAPIWASLT